MNNYEPELGQALFGQPTQQYECPDIIEAGLRCIHLVLNDLNGGKLTPFNNSGEHFTNDVFEVHAYYWGDCDCSLNDTGDEYIHKSNCPVIRPNFKCGDLEVNWYKYLGRGMSINRQITIKEFNRLLLKCLKSLE